MAGQRDRQAEDFPRRIRSRLSGDAANRSEAAWTSGALNSKPKRQFRLLAIMVIASAFVGLAYAPILGSFLEFEVTFDRCWRFAAQGALLGGFLAFYQLVLSQTGAARWLRRLPLLLEIVGKGAISTALIALALLLGAVLLFPERFEDGAMALSFLRDTLFAFGAMLVLQFVLVVRSVIGGRVLLQPPAPGGGRVPIRASGPSLHRPSRHHDCRKHLW